LQSNLKERTENVMIVDVARNDLSRIAKKGSVTVDKLCDIESYQQVHQMVSTVSCELKENTSFKDIINATFPMASMTGAPKIRAMELIDEYELYNRGPYSGVLGYIDENGDFDLSVLIRSIFYDEEKQYLSFTVGSAITAMCNAEDEYEECLLKAKAMMEVLTVIDFDSTKSRFTIYKCFCSYFFLINQFKIYCPFAKSSIDIVFSGLIVD
jgi:para-aminobenzoate synthetase component 1